MDNRKSSQNLTCEFCSKTFSNIYNLKKHVSTAKVCISKRPKIEEVNPNEEKFLCEYCRKEFVKYHLKTHLTICTQRDVHTLNKKLKKVNDELEREKDTVLELEIFLEREKERNRELELQLAENKGEIKTLKKTRTKRITNNINNYINPKLAKIQTEGLPYLTQEYIENLVDGYTFDYFMQGPSGIAQFFKECVVLPPLPPVENYEEIEDAGTLTTGEEDFPRIMYPCTDSSRHKYYKHEITGWKLDVGAPFLSTAIDALKDTANEHHKKLIDMSYNHPDYTMREIYDEEKNKIINPMMIGIKCKKGPDRNKLISEVSVCLKSHVSI